MAKPGRSGIYTITLTIDGRQYVGSSINVDARWNFHLSELRRGIHHSPHLQYAYDKYGPAALVHEVIEDCVPELLLEREQLWIDKLEPAFNSAPVAGSCLGYRHTDEAKANMGASHIGFRHSDETKEKCRIAKLGNTDCVGRVMSEETRAKTSASLKGKPKSAEHRAKMLGHIVTEETRAKISEKQKAAWARRRLSENPDNQPT